MRFAALFAGATLGAGLLLLPVSAPASLPVAPPVESETFAPGVTSLNPAEPNVTRPGIIKTQVSGSIHFGRHPSRRHPHWCRYRWRGRCYQFRHRGMYFRHRRWNGRRWAYW